MPWKWMSSVKGSYRIVALTANYNNSSWNPPRCMHTLLRQFRMWSTTNGTFRYFLPSSISLFLVSLLYLHVKLLGQPLSQSATLVSAELPASSLARVWRIITSTAESGGPNEGDALQIVRINWKGSLLWNTYELQHERNYSQTLLSYQNQEIKFSSIITRPEILMKVEETPESHFWHNNLINILFHWRTTINKVSRCYNDSEGIYEARSDSLNATAQNPPRTSPFQKTHSSCAGPNHGY